MKRILARAAAGLLGALLLLGTAEGGPAAAQRHGSGGGAAGRAAPEDGRGGGECGRGGDPVTIVDVVERRVVTIDPRKRTLEEQRFEDVEEEVREALGKPAGGPSGSGRDGPPPARHPGDAPQAVKTAPDPTGGDGSVSYCRDGRFRIIVGGKAAREIWISGKTGLKDDDLDKVRKQLERFLGNGEPGRETETDVLEALRRKAGGTLEEFLDKPGREDDGDK